MFNILVSASRGAWEPGQRMRMHRDRFREYSGDEAEAISLDDPHSLKALEHVTTLLMYEEEVVEGPAGDVVRVGQLHDIQADAGSLTFRFIEHGRLSRRRVHEESDRFQLADFEFYRTHWAIKDGEAPHDILAEMVETPKTYDIVLSFAGEDRAYVEQVFNRLEAAGIAVFYDKNERATLWGKNLAEHFHVLYRTRGRYCVMFISRHYAEKAWPTHERRSALDRAVQQRTEYILPVRIDDTEIPGVLSGVAYEDARKTTADELAVLILQKLGRHH